MSVSSNPNELMKVIDSLMDELDQLASKTETGSDELFDRALETLDAVMQPESSAIFILGPDGIPCNVNRAEPIESYFPEWTASLGDLRASPDGCIAQDQKRSNCSGFAIFKKSENDSDLIGLLAVKTAKVERSGATQSLMKAIADLISRFISVQSDRAESSNGDFLKRVTEFSIGCLSSLDEQELSKVVANDARMLLGCERVQIFKNVASRFSLQAVSSVSVFEKRTELLRCSARIAKQACRTNAPILSSQVSDHGHLQASIDEYRELSGMPFFAFFPLQAKLRNRKPRAPGGVLLAEFAEIPLFFEFVRAANIVIPQSSLALFNVQTISSIPFHNTLFFLGRSLNLKGLTRFLLYVVLPVALLFLTFFIQTDFKIRMHGSLRPATEQLVFSPHDSFVENVLVEHGESVTEGQLLVELRSPALNLELEEAMGEIQKLTKFKAAKIIAINQASTGNVDDRSIQAKLASEVADLQFQISSYEDKRDYTQRRIDELKIYSPIAGRIVTWNVEKLLREKPVRWGDPLLKVADESGDWELKFKAAEKKIGYILNASNSQPGSLADLNVEYFFESNPDQKFSTSIENISSSTEIDAEVGPSVAVNCEIDPKQTLKRHGAKVVGDVVCGRRPIAFVWTYELVDAVRRQFVW